MDSGNLFSFILLLVNIFELLFYALAKAFRLFACNCIVEAAFMHALVASLAEHNEVARLFIADIIIVKMVDIDFDGGFAD